MKRLKYIALSVFALCSVLSAPLYAQDFARLSERSIMGTARYVGMGGAMSAIGGDPSAVLDNPAGLGLYQRMEVMVTFDEIIDHTWQVNGATKQRRTLFMCPQASVVFSHPTWTLNPKGVQFFNFMLSYRRMHTFNRSFDAVGGADVSLGAILPTINIPFCDDLYNTSNALNLREWGHVNEYSFDWSMNIGHQWYVGMGLHLQDYLLSSDAVYQEYFDAYSVEGSRYSNINKSSLQFSGISCNLSVGLIYRPLKWLRLGVGLQTPTIGSFHARTAGTFYAQTDSLRVSYAPDLTYNERNFHMPLHLSSSVAFQCGAYGMLSLQYDYLKQLKEPAVHSLRVGLEVVPVLGMYVNAGYVYESTFKPATTIVPMDPSFDRQDTYFLRPRSSQYASVAIGYRGTFMMVQAAYQYRWQRMNLFAHEAAQPYDMHTDTHRIVVTIGWHHN